MLNYDIKIFFNKKNTQKQSLKNIISNNEVIFFFVETYISELEQLTQNRPFRGHSPPLPKPFL